MEAVLLLIILGVGGYFLFGNFKVNARDPETLTKQDSEAVWVEIKGKILQTSPYTHEDQYNKLYKRARDLLGALIDRHRHFIDDFQANQQQFSNVGSYLTEINGQIHEGRERRVTSNLSLENIPSDLLFFLCIISYNGALLKDYGLVSYNKWFVNRGVEFLISQRKYAPAIFLKGFVFKYGYDVFDTPNLVEARPLFEKAAQLGVGASLLELEHLDLHENLKSIKTVHMKNDEWLEGQELRKFEEARKDWIR